MVYGNRNINVTVDSNTIAADTKDIPGPGYCDIHSVQAPDSAFMSVPGGARFLR